jgi:hypothetical protein
MASHLMMLLVPSAAGLTSIEVEYLVVAAGGGGGVGDIDQEGGGGGAGGLITGTTTLARGVAVTLTVGNDEGATAGNSVLGTLEAIGGGQGGNFNTNGSSGGSGGGGGRASSGTTSGGAGTSGQGTAGGNGNTDFAGRGGGAGSAGGSGGAGTSSSITGTAVTYARGGDWYDGTTPSANTGSGGRGGAIVAGDGIVVEGAGTAAANGTYEPDGTLNGKTRYRLGSTTYYIVWIGTDIGNWVVSDDSGGSNTLYTGSSDPASPIGGTSVAAGASPAPSIANEETSIEATAGADGVVIIAYPNTLPALTVGAGLTYDEPTRAGYRVYRFTSGTGTITP